jgi:hypothetical protein
MSGKLIIHGYDAVALVRLQVSLMWCATCGLLS